MVVICMQDVEGNAKAGRGAKGFPDEEIGLDDMELGHRT